MDKESGSKGDKLEHMGKKITITVLIILTACNLRAPITSIGSLINTISMELGLSSAVSGLLTTIPLLAFAVISPVVVCISRKTGAGNLLMLSLIFVNVGIAMRSFGGNAGLFTGTLFIGFAIGVGNVLLPAFIKTYFPNKIESMTSLYTVVMQVASAGCVAVSVPASNLAGWEWALLITMPMSIMALICCIPNRQISISQETEVLEDGEEMSEDKRTNTNVYRSSLSWWIAFYMGAQSLIFYSFIAWLSPIMQDKGFNDTQSGYILSAFVLMGFAGSATLPFIMKRNREQTITGIQLGILYFVGIVAMMFGKSFPIMFMAILLCGFCSGAFISFVMALFGLHTSNGEDASRLSGLAQSMGYLIAAAGPIFLGKAHDLWGGWMIPMGILALTSVLLIIMGRIVGRNEII